MNGTSLIDAQHLDQEDTLHQYKNDFYFPKNNKGKEVLYFTGNSLGLQPRQTKDYIKEVLDDWKNLGVEGHFHAKKPWIDYHKQLINPLTKIVGALPNEVTVMNSLTTNLHLLMASFYRPTPNRYKIICEEKAFPSDAYILQSQARFHGFEPSKAIIKIQKRKNENNFRTEDILQTLEEHKNQCTLILIGGVNYYSGEVFDIERITSKAKEIGAIIGWDLAHAVGNIELKLHQWNVDFAAWCSYKYMNAGPGSISGCFIHENQLKTYINNPDLPRLEGWWGNQQSNRFMMKETFTPEPSIEAWQLSNPPIFALAPYLASLNIFDKIGMPALISKQKKLFDFLIKVLTQIKEETKFEMEWITPTETSKHGCQLSLYVPYKGKDIFKYLIDNGVSVDWREPNLMRIAAVPLYNSFTDVWYLGQYLRKAIKNIH